MISATVEIKVEMYDVDAMQVVWHGNYVRYLEAARNALFEKIGFGYAAMAASGYSWPVVDLRIRYRRPARLGQRLRVLAALREWENRICLDYSVEDAASGEKLTRADSVQLAVDMKNGELQYVSPEPLVAKIREALA